MQRAALLLLALAPVAGRADTAAGAERLVLLPYPQEVQLLGGRLAAGPPACETVGAMSATERIAAESLGRYLPRTGPKVPVRLGSVEEGFDPKWLSAEQAEFLARPETSAEASVLAITKEGITVVGKGKWGMLFGVQTINQLAIQAAREGRDSFPCLKVRDWPDAAWRCLAPQLAWYAGWSTRREGYDNGNWSLDEWKWFVDWSLLHKFNAWAVCMYGNWPFTLPGYEADTLDFDSFRYDPATGLKTPYRYTHRNIKKEFLPELIRYANARGVRVHAYIGKNTFNGTYIRRHPEAASKSLVAEAIPFTPGLSDYWDAFLGRIIESGFNGFVLEDPETHHVPNGNARCFETFWEPWAAEYGFKKVADTDPNKPPLGVHIEYNAWVFREFDRLIRSHARRLGRPDPEMYLISHILLNRVMTESKSREVRARWFALLDRKNGRKVPFILFEDREREYVELLGKGRAATLGGRGGAAAGCFRIANINNDRMHGDLGMDLAEERAKQRRMIEAGGFGSMSYVFQWTTTEVFGYLGSQYLWRRAGVPGVDNDDDFGILDYSYRVAYGDEAGALVARSLARNSCVSEWHVFEDDPPMVFFGGPLHRDFRLLAALTDESDALALRAYRAFTGRDPDLFHLAYDPDAFRWDGYDRAADTQFKAERLRLLCVSARRARALCEAALASRQARQRIAEGATIGEVRQRLDAAVAAARQSEVLYLANYDDDYTTGDDGTRLRKKLEGIRARFLADCGPEADPRRTVPEAVRSAHKRPRVIAWEKQTDLLPERPEARTLGLYLSTDLGLAGDIDYYCVGSVFTVEGRRADGSWRTLFRRALLKNDVGWQHWEIPLDAETVALRLTTEASSRAVDRSAPRWDWGYWGRPRVVRVASDGTLEVVDDLVEHRDRARALVQLDDTGGRRAFDRGSVDSTGATFEAVASGGGMPEPSRPAIRAFPPHRAGASGVTIAEYPIAVQGAEPETRKTEDNRP
jgi:hypothetical protein